MQFLLWQLIVATLAGGAAGFTVKHRVSQNKEKKIEQELEELGAKKDKEATKLKEEALAEVERLKENLSEREARLDKREQSIDNRQTTVDNEREKLEEKEKVLDEQKEEVSKALEKEQKELEKVSKLKKEEAKELLLKSIEREYKEDILNQIKKYKDTLKEDSERESKKILSTVIERLASEHTAETTVFTVQIPSEDIKGRIIGKEGRNIQVFERVTGCDVVIDETPDSVQISCFDPVRRYVGKLSLERLIADGRIQPSRIEEIVKKTEEDVMKEAKKAAEEVAYDLGLPGLHPDILKILGRLKFRTSYGQNQLEHAKEVAEIAGLLSGELGADANIAKKAGLLHDLGKAVDQEIQAPHHHISMDIARKYGMSEVVINAIGAHHDDVEPKTVEAIIVKAADAISGARPGSRRESVENYVKRLKELENVANSFAGVDKSFAIQAGREVRIIVRPEEIDDLEALKLAKDIAQKIEKELQYPGQIKVNVIRETRALEIAK